MVLYVTKNRGKLLIFGKVGCLWQCVVRMFLQPLSPPQSGGCMSAGRYAAFFYAPANAQAGCAYSRMPEAGEMQIK